MASALYSDTSCEAGVGLATHLQFRCNLRMLPYKYIHPDHADFSAGVPGQLWEDELQSLSSEASLSSCRAAASRSQSLKVRRPLTQAAKSPGW